MDEQPSLAMSSIVTVLIIFEFTLTSRDICDFVIFFINFFICVDIEDIKTDKVRMMIK
jgi:hypothetical protein